MQKRRGEVVGETGGVRGGGGGRCEWRGGGQGGRGSDPAYTILEDMRGRDGGTGAGWAGRG